MNMVIYTIVLFPLGNLMKDLSTYVLKITNTLFQRVFLIIVYSIKTIDKKGIYGEAIHSCTPLFVVYSTSDYVP